MNQTNKNNNKNQQKQKQNKIKNDPILTTPITLSLAPSDLLYFVKEGFALSVIIPLYNCDMRCPLIVFRWGGVVGGFFFHCTHKSIMAFILAQPMEG